jgi:hypothetical protein
MSITSVGTLGNGVVGASGSANCSLTTSAAIEAGNVALLWWSSENSSTADGNTNEHTSVTDSAGAVSWTKLYEYCNANGAADAGITTSLWYRPKQGSTLASSSTITGTRTDSRADQTMLAWEFATTYDLIDDTSGPVGNATDGSNGFGSAAFSGLTSKERLYFRSLGKKANVASTTDLTPSASFTMASNIRSRNNAAATTARGEFRINTSTGETSDPTFAFTGDTAAVFVGLVEDVPAASVPAPIIAPSSMAHVARRQRELRARRLGSTLIVPGLTTGADAFTLMADPATFTLTGNNATLRRGYSLTAAVGTCALTGQDVTLRAARQLVASQATFTLTGNATALRVARQLAADLATFALTGQDATLTYSGASGGYTLTADAGTFTLTGTATGLRAGRQLVAALGSFSLSAPDAGLRVARMLLANPGSYTLTGADVGLARGLSMTAGTGAFAATGIDAALRIGRRLTVDAGAFTLTGRDVALNWSGAFSNLGEYVITLRAGTRYTITESGTTRYTIEETS